jgi:hypothetical protein
MFGRIVMSHHINKMSLSDQSIYISWIVAAVILFIIWSRVSSAPDIESKTVTLTAAQINALYTTKVTLVAAIPNKRIVLIDADLSVKAGSEAFTDGGAVAIYVGSSAITDTWAATVVTGADTTPLKNPIYLPSTNISAPVNTAITIGAATADFEAGNGTAKVTVRYYVV